MVEQFQRIITLEIFKERQKSKLMPDTKYYTKFGLQIIPESSQARE